jgi:hypothetical protein
MRDFLGPKGLGEVLGLSLTNPVFQQTVVGLMYTPAQEADCNSSGNEFALDIEPDAGLALPEGTVPFEYAALAQGDIASSLLNQGTIDAGALPAGTSPWYLEAALAGAYSGLQSISGASEYNRRAVMLFYDRNFNVGTSTDCPQPHPDAIAEANTALQEGIETYAVYLANADYDGGIPPGNPAAAGAELARGLGTGGIYFFNAAAGAEAQATAAKALASVVADLGSCVYEVPLHFVPGSPLSFPDYSYNPASCAGAGSPPSTATVSYAASCATDDACGNPLYVFDNQHIRICQNTCQRLVSSIVASEILSAGRNQGLTTPLPPLPVDVEWGYTCGAPIPDASIVESGSAPLPPPVVDAGPGEDAAVGTFDGGIGQPDAATPPADSGSP